VLQVMRCEYSQICPTCPKRSDRDSLRTLMKKAVEDDEDIDGK